LSFYLRQRVKVPPLLLAVILQLQRDQHLLPQITRNQLIRLLPPLAQGGSQHQPLMPLQQQAIITLLYQILQQLIALLLHLKRQPPRLLIQAPRPLIMLPIQLLPAMEVFLLLLPHLIVQQPLLFTSLPTLLDIIQQQPPHLLHPTGLSVLPRPPLQVKAILLHLPLPPILLNSLIHIQQRVTQLLLLHPLIHIIPLLQQIQLVQLGLIPVLLVDIIQHLLLLQIPLQPQPLVHIIKVELQQVQQRTLPLPLVVILQQ
jgi:hypothetical protein